MAKRKLFCEINPLTYAISLYKEIIKRHVKNYLSHERFTVRRQEAKLPVVVYSTSNNMIKRGPGIDAVLQQNKADNIRLACSKINGLVVWPQETFSFWRVVGKTSKRNGFTEGRVLVNGRLVAGVGGGLCNLANTLHLLALHSSLTITERHYHSDALAPDPDGRHVPFSSGTSVNWNFLDLRFRNDTDQPMQLSIWTEGDTLRAELRTTVELPHFYRLTDEDHHFHLEDDGKYYRLSRIYRETIDKATGNLLARELIRDNHSEVMYDYSLIPPEQIR